MGRCFHLITCQRHLSLLNHVFGWTRAGTLQKLHQKLLNQETELLFGEKFKATLSSEERNALFYGKSQKSKQKPSAHQTHYQSDQRHGNFPNHGHSGGSSYKNHQPNRSGPSKGGGRPQERTAEVKSLSFPQRRVPFSPVPIHTPVPLPQKGNLFQLHLLESFLPPPREDLKVGGKIKFHLQNWWRITHDPQILQIVKGYKIPLTRTVPLSNTPYRPPKLQEAIDTLDKEVVSMKEKRAIQVVRFSDKSRVFSHLFVTPKKDEGYRPIINLKKVNSAISYKHF